MTRLYRDRISIDYSYFKDLAIIKVYFFNSMKTYKYILIKYTKELLQTARIQEKCILHVTFH